VGQTWFDKWRGRFRGAWHVLTGRAWAGYGDPENWIPIERGTAEGDTMRMMWDQIEQAQK
jgi:hypothetical protein